MCGISGIIHHPNATTLLQPMLEIQHERGPDARGVYANEDNNIALGHNRLSIIDLSSAANQPMYSHNKRYVMVYNGEVYNYTELRDELKNSFSFTTQSDSEVLLAAYEKWGADMLPKLNGMFAFAIWDTQAQQMFMARDRFGVKPFYYTQVNHTFVFASEIKAIHATGLIPKAPNHPIWTTYFANSLYDHTADTFWNGISQLPAGSYAHYKHNTLSIHTWYNIEEQVSNTDSRDEAQVMDELLHLLESSIAYRFRADVPVGVCLSGGLDSSLLLALVHRVKGKDFPLHAFTFYTGDERYDELPWVQQLIAQTPVIHHACLLKASEIPELATSISQRMDEPYGGIPTLGMGKVFAAAKQQGITVLLDGNGMDEAWGGYEYYQRAASVDMTKGPVQGAISAATLNPYIKASATASVHPFRGMGVKTDALTQLQLRDLLLAKIPRAMRFADRNSMTYSTELREPFLDYRLVELGLRQPLQHKIQNGQGKYLVRKLAEEIIPKKVSEAPKRALQTPQREWLADDLKPWVEQLLHEHADTLSHWFEPIDLKKIYADYCTQKPDNSFYIWQLVNAVLLLRK
jgi:asparagine synthase (glutamine-hydrolysing)